MKMKMIKLNLKLSRSKSGQIQAGGQTEDNDYFSWHMDDLEKDFLSNTLCIAKIRVSFTININKEFIFTPNHDQTGLLHMKMMATQLYYILSNLETYIWWSFIFY